MKLFNITIISLLAGMQIITAATSTYTAQSCVTRDTSKSTSKVSTTIHRNTIKSVATSTIKLTAQTITITPPGQKFISTSLATATTPVPGLQVTDTITETRVHSTATITTQSTTTSPTSPGFNPLASNSAVIYVAIAAGGASKKV
ncbi:hypothetical protein SBOR_3798 [Sclerotinia borealis F-4128]|uniref:Uncharacterized protein n=1 Tax=Sclerotinia borealis (strain F-4128) TaxID=1432307 RepID=W9CIT9_SCLBF|nr:hypothetical protein SBOR_3798 [Sclerotinia borealis F-4128]